MICTDRIKNLCKEKGITIARLEKELGFANGTIASTKSNNMRSDRLKAIADYFHVSMEYLLTGKTDEELFEEVWRENEAARAFYQDENTLPLEEAAHLSILRVLPKDKRQEVYSYAEFLMEQEKKKQKKSSKSSKEA